MNNTFLSSRVEDKAFLQNVATKEMNVSFIRFFFSIKFENLIFNLKSAGYIRFLFIKADLVLARNTKQQVK